MVLDTKWKRFKFSNSSKLLCVIAAMLLIIVMVMNAIQIINFGLVFGDDIFHAETTDIYSTYSFQNMLLDSISRVEGDVTEPSRDAKQEKFVNDFYKKYDAAEAENRIAYDDIEKRIYAEHAEEDFFDETDVEYILEEGYFEDGTQFYRGNDGYYYDVCMAIEDNSLVVPDSSKNCVRFGYSKNDILEQVSSYYNEINNNQYSHYRYYIDYSDLRNVQIYAVHKDGTVITNVKNTKELVQNVKNGKGEYILYEAGKDVASTSTALSFVQNTELFSGNEEFSIYIQIDPEFQQDDVFNNLYNNYLHFKDINLNSAFACCVVSLLLLIILAVITCRLAGHKDGKLSMAKIDKMPVDLHFVLMGIPAFGAGAGFCALFYEYIYLFERYYLYFGSYDFDIAFYSSGWFVAAMCAIVMIIWLLILSFAASLSRVIKCGYPVLSKLLIVRIIVLIYKVLRWIIKGIFKIIRKIFTGFGRMIAAFAFKPKMLHKRSVPAVVLYTLFNFIMFGLIILLFIPGEAFLFLLSCLCIILLLGADSYLIYRAVKYMKSLDSIILASEKGEPLPYNTATLPKSLKILADSLETTNAQLQQAVNKAVKDERTKTELITNVSHDLKTPLTSVINYIDLLQKCDIKDETAQQYMQVIAEKSNKLKRLIEDLIEASKVSTGNVTINKTLLNLNELAAQAIVEETADIEKNNLQIIFEEAVDKHIAFADGTKIYRVFENLLSNARKYSAPGSRIYARVYSDNHFGYFEIKNMSKDPLNISAEELTERFVRGDESRSQDGNGLGLSIAKELCKLNNGELLISIDGDLFKATVKLPKNNQ